MSGVIHVVGAGLAGLAAAVSLTQSGRSVRVHEAAGQAGGRCRSYFDSSLGAVIDNGNHLLLSGNRAALDYLKALGASDRLTGPPHAEFAFADLATGERWTLAMNDGPLPFWIFDGGRRVPGTKAADYLALLPLLLDTRQERLGPLLRARGALYRRLIEPLFVAALNTELDPSSAALARAILRDTLMKGGSACRPLVAAHGLSSAFVDPALAFLERSGTPVAFGRRLRGIAFGADRVGALDFGGDGEVALGPDDGVVLAVPAPVATALVPGLTGPTAFRAIVNAHFAAAPPPGLPPLLGVVNGTVEWLFSFEGRLSVTISNADRYCDQPREELARTIWQDVAALTGLTEMPRWQIVRERRATFAALPEEDRKRPPADTRWANLVLAGDWTATGLPSTIEGAIRSGNRAAALVSQGRSKSTSRRMTDPRHATSTIEHPVVAPEAVGAALGAARRALAAEQQDDGHFVFELEADATIPSEYILLHHYLGEPASPEIEAKVAAYLRRTQGAHDGWALLQDGPFNISCSVKAYFALKAIGDDPDLPHMRRARAAILAAGGAAQSNVFTRFLLALFGAVPWRGVPVMPVELMLLPRWFPFHLDKVSYWARTVIVPLTVITAFKPKARNPRGVGIPELFVAPPETVRNWPKPPHSKEPWRSLFGGLDHVLRVVEPMFPGRSRQVAIDKAVAFVLERLNGEDGLGAIFPAMSNSVIMLDMLGYPRDDPRVATILRGIEKLLVIKEHEAYCQPCVSPVWDTALACHALMEVGDEDSLARAGRGLDWLKGKQVRDVVGDWAAQRPDVRPGGWAFQYENPHYPDLDDTAVVVMAMDRASGRVANGGEFRDAIDRGAEWVGGLQSRDGGFAAFDADNDKHYLNHIPFADHGALLDPPTADVTARCVSMFAQLGETPATSARLRRGGRLPDRGSGSRRLLVRPLGHELHLWHLVGAVRPERRRGRSRVAHSAASRRMAHDDPERRRRLGRGRVELRPRLSRLRAGSQHGLADLLGRAGPDGCRRGGTPGRRPRHRLPGARTRRRRVLARRSVYRDRFSAHLLPALSRIFEIFPLVGARPL